MFNAYHLINAVPVAFVGIVALWAAASRRHWFLRTAVVLAVVTAPLLIPAYEITFEAAVQSLVIAIGVAIWRIVRWRRENSEPFIDSLRPRVSLQNLLFFSVIVAIVTAAIANSPKTLWLYPNPSFLIWPQWLVLASKGLFDGCAVLASAWLALGKLHWAVRTLGCIVATTAAAAGSAFIFAGVNNVYWWQIGGYSSGVGRPSVFHEFLWYLLPEWIKVYAVIVGLVYIWVWLLQRANFPTNLPRPAGARTSEPRTAVRHRRRVAAYTLLIAALPTYLLLRLLNPTPIPRTALIEPNGYDALLEAGRMISPADDNVFSNRYTAAVTNQMVDASLANSAEAYIKLRNALTLPYGYPYPYERPPRDDLQAMGRLDGAIGTRIELLYESQEFDTRISTCRDVLRLAHERMNGPGIENDSEYIGWESLALGQLGALRTKLSASQCRELAEELSRLDGKRVPWKEIRHRLQVIDERTCWQFHLQTIAEAWSGIDRRETDEKWYFASRTKVRLAAIELALQAYQQEHGAPPKSLSELAPGYLPEVPLDPHIDAPFHYQITGNSYLLYGVGHDLVDNGGTPEEVLSWGQDGDITFEYLIREHHRRQQAASGNNAELPSQSAPT